MAMVGDYIPAPVDSLAATLTGAVSAGIKGYEEGSRIARENARYAEEQRQLERKKALEVPVEELKKGEALERKIKLGKLELEADQYEKIKPMLAINDAAYGAMLGDATAKDKYNAQVAPEMQIDDIYRERRPGFEGWVRVKEKGGRIYWMRPQMDPKDPFSSAWKGFSSTKDRLEISDLAPADQARAFAAAAPEDQQKMLDVVAAQTKLEVAQLAQKEDLMGRSPAFEATLKKHEDAYKLSVDDLDKLEKQRLEYDKLIEKASTSDSVGGRAEAERLTSLRAALDAKEQAIRLNMKTSRDAISQLTELKLRYTAQRGVVGGEPSWAKYLRGSTESKPTGVVELPPEAAAPESPAAPAGPKPGEKRQLPKSRAAEEAAAPAEKPAGPRKALSDLESPAEAALSTAGAAVSQTAGAAARGVWGAVTALKEFVEDSPVQNLAADIPVTKGLNEENSKWLVKNHKDHQKKIERMSKSDKNVARKYDDFQSAVLTLLATSKGDESGMLAHGKYSPRFAAEANRPEVLYAIRDMYDREVRGETDMLSELDRTIARYVLLEHRQQLDPTDDGGEVVKRFEAQRATQQKEQQRLQKEVPAYIQQRKG